MKRALVLCLVALSAFAGERMLGRISEITTTTSNLSQSPDGSAVWWDGGYEMPFCIPEMALVTLVCNVQENVCTDATTCTAVTGLPVPANTIFPTSVGSMKGALDQGPNPDGGLLGGARVNPIRCAAISIFNTVADGGYHYCSVWERKGNE